MQIELKHLQKKLGITFIYITHDQEEAINMSDRIAVMRDGRIEQIGTPDEIYNHPKTSYVATFVGNANILHGVAESIQGENAIVKIGNDKVIVKLETSQQNTGAKQHLTAGENVTLAVRSENILLQEAAAIGDTGTDNGDTVDISVAGGISDIHDTNSISGLQATVTEKNFAGGQLRVTLKLSDGTQLIASRYGIDASVAEGQTVRCSFLPADAVLVDRRIFMKKRRNRSDSSAWMALPLYIFTIVFVVCPLIYMVALSFATPSRGFGVTWKFTLDNYRNILEPVYLNTFVESLKLAFTSTIVIALIGYPFGYFMARLPEHRKKKAQLLLSTPFWVNSLIRLYGWIIILQKKGLLNFVLIKLGIIEKPLSILYSYPAIVIGMIYVLLPFMIMSVYSSAEKLDWSYVEAARDLGASRMQAFFTIILKLTLPGLLSGVILTFVPSMGLFFIADILGGNKVVLVGSLIQDQMTRGSNWPFAAALAVVMMVLTTVLIMIYRKVTNAGELEGIG